MKRRPPPKRFDIAAIRKALGQADPVRALKDTLFAQPRPRPTTTRKEARRHDNGPR